MKIKNIIVLVLLVVVLFTGCDGYDDNKGIHSNGDNAIYLDTNCVDCQ